MAYTGSSATESFTGAAGITLSFNTDGTWDITGDVGGVLASGSWINASPVGDYAVRFTLDAGSVTSGSSVDTWLSLSSARFQRIAIGSGTQSATFTVEVNYEGGAALESQSFSITSDAN